VPDKDRSTSQTQENRRHEVLPIEVRGCDPGQGL